VSTRSFDVPLHAEARTPGIPATVIVAGILILCGATTGLLRGVEPFATFYYHFAWISVLLVMDGVIALRGAAGAKGEFLLLDRPRHLLSLMAWSAVVWIFYELLNFRLQNWYYINLPTTLSIRWLSTLVAFASVLPAVFLSFTVMRSFGVAENVRWKPFSIADRLHWLRIAGVIMMALVLVWPKYFYPLVWGATTLLVEPWVYRRSPKRSLLHDLEHGRPARLLRLLAGGVLIGFLWESLNIAARAKWIYTVPGLEDLKLFEMPLLGFFGFPPFALECFVLWQALVVAGVALPRDGVRFPASGRRRMLAPVAALALCAVVLWQMDRATISSFRPHLNGVAGEEAPVLASAGLDVYSLARSSRAEVAAKTGLPIDSAVVYVERARLTTLRGIGAHYALLMQASGIATVDDLARADAHDLIENIERLSGERLKPARVRVWIKGAKLAVAKS
jgi:predicted flap endonuclease-1-like 5' DNA nuclease